MLQLLRSWIAGQFSPAQGDMETGGRRVHQRRVPGYRRRPGCRQPGAGVLYLTGASAARRDTDTGQNSRPQPYAARQVHRQHLER